MERELRRGSEMLKRSVLVAIAVASLLALSASAGEIKHYNWPGHWVWDAQDICTIPVYVKIGMFVQILNQGDLEIILNQTDWQTYEGCVDFQIKCNFRVELGCHVTSTGAMPGTYSCSISGGNVVEPTYSGDAATRDVCVRVEEARIVHLEPNDKVKVADVTITVKPAA
jgi:hypothetical protein